MARLIDSIAELDGFQASWEALAGGDPLSGFAYARAWAGTLGPAESLHVLVEEGDQALGIAPLILQRRGAGWLTQIALETYEILDLPCRDGATASALAGAIYKSGRPLFLNRVPLGSPMVQAIDEAYRRRGWVIRKQGTGSPYIALDDSWRQPESHLNSGRRSDLRRARRHADESGGVGFEIHSPSASELPALMEEVFRVEAAGWKGATGTALAVDPGLRSFYQQYAALAQRQGVLRVCFLKIGERAAAAQLAVETEDRFSLLKVGYDEEFARCSPGLLLTVETIRHAAERGLRSYEFNGKVERWTEVWTKDERPCCSIRAYPMSVRGFTALASGGCRAAWRKLR
jgi:CelD/BcsL family acetyltransferase involved in cellulose biosynthesis